MVGRPHRVIRGRCPGTRRRSRDVMQAAAAAAAAAAALS